MSRLTEFKLNSLQPGGKLLCTLFLVCMGIGYAFSQLNLFFSYSKADGKSGMSLQDIALTFNGRPGELLIESKLNGTMCEKIDNELDKNSLIAWAKRGAKKEKFSEIKNIIVSKCLKCHTAGGEAAFAPYDKLSSVTETFTRINRGIPVPRLISLSHTHMTGIGLIFALTGVIFLFTAINEKLKIALIVFPFGSLLLNILGWWLTKLSPSFAIMVFIGIHFCLIAFITQLVISLISMWRSAPARR